jgi:hypothetical protein
MSKATRNNIAKTAIIVLAIFEALLGCGLPFILLGLIFHILPGKLSSALSFAIFGICAFVFYSIVKVCFMKIEKKLGRIAKNED